MPFKGISFNIDSVIRAKSNHQFTQQHVRSITVKSINLQLLNADSENNLGNYEYYISFGVNYYVAKVLKIPTNNVSGVGRFRIV